MPRRPPVLRLLVWSLLPGLVLLSGCVQKRDASPAAPATAPGDSIAAKKDVPYVTTPQRMVEHMLRMADVSEHDVVYDLGSGDGRFVITAAQQFGARGVGVEIDPQLVRRARSSARLAGVSDRVEFRQGNLFETDLHDASVVTLYLEPKLNLRLRPTLLRHLDPGDRVVSHEFDMGNWTPTRVDTMDGDPLYLWTIPKQLPDSLTQR